MTGAGLTMTDLCWWALAGAPVALVVLGGAVQGAGRALADLYRRDTRLRTVHPPESVVADVCEACGHDRADVEGAGCPCGHGLSPHPGTCEPTRARGGCPGEP